MHLRRFGLHTSAVLRPLHTGELDELFRKQSMMLQKMENLDYGVEKFNGGDRFNKSCWPLPLATFPAGSCSLFLKIVILLLPHYLCFSSLFQALNINDPSDYDEPEADPADDDKLEANPGENFMANPAMRFAFERCGLNATTATYVMIDQGFDTTEELYMSSKDNSRI